MEEQRVMPLRDAPDSAPYFSQIVIPGDGKRAEGVYE
jgi:precorrin-2/cobalt-factor-2 C20-methyltransferase